MLLDVDRLDEQADLEAALERTALSTIALFFKRRLQMIDYHSEKELEDKRAAAEAAGEIGGGNAQVAEILVQQPDRYMRRGRYQRLHETLETHAMQSPRTTWNGPSKLFDELVLGGAAQYDIVKSRCDLPGCVLWFVYLFVYLYSSIVHVYCVCEREYLLVLSDCSNLYLQRSADVILCLSG